MTSEPKSAREGGEGTPSDFIEALESFRAPDGRSLRAHAADRPMLIVFLRHGGCPFCKETLSRLRAARAEIDRAGVGIGLVHLMSESEAAPFFAAYGMGDAPRFSDPDRRLYRAFGLRRGPWSAVAGPSVWGRGLWATLRGHLPGVPRGDVFQLPGTFLLHRDEIRTASRPENSAGDVDFVEFLGRWKDSEAAAKN